MTHLLSYECFHCSSKFETLRREIKADVRKQHDLYANNLVGDVKANPRDFYRYINSQKKDTQGADRTFCPLIFWTWTFNPPDILDQNVSSPDILDLDVWPPDTLDQEVSTPDFLDLDFSHPERFAHGHFGPRHFAPGRFGTGRFAHCHVWSRTFRPLPFF